jgi:hypothetical protein
MFASSGFWIEVIAFCVGVGIGVRVIIFGILVKWGDNQNNTTTIIRVLNYGKYGTMCGYQHSGSIFAKYLWCVTIFRRFFTIWL